MKRAVDPAFLESIANHPSVRPYLGGDGKSEFRTEDTWAQTIALEWPEGGLVFLRHAPGLYSGHFVFLPHTPDVAGKCREALDYMFTQTDAERIFGTTPLPFKHAIRTAKRAGFRHTHTANGLSHCELTRQQWLERHG